MVVLNLLLWEEKRKRTLIDLGVGDPKKDS